MCVFSLKNPSYPGLDIGGFIGGLDIGDFYRSLNIRRFKTFAQKNLLHPEYLCISPSGVMCLDVHPEVIRSNIPDIWKKKNIPIILGSQYSGAKMCLDVHTKVIKIGCHGLVIQLAL